MEINEKTYYLYSFHIENITIGIVILVLFIGYILLHKNFLDKNCSEIIESVQLN